MRGLEFEFERFQTICLADVPPDEIENIKAVFMAGALAASDRILAILNSGMPNNRKAALLRRVARECQSFKNEITNAAERNT
jgi:hypothetical protein